MPRKRKPAPAKAHPVPASLSRDPIDDALTRHAAQSKADEAALLADPVFRAAADHGERWKLAQRAAEDATAPFRVELNRLTAEHPTGCDPDSQAFKRIEALAWAVRDAESRAYAEHGFGPATPPRSPAELLARLKSIEHNWLFDLQETANNPRPTDFLWRDAEGLRNRDPFLPELPAKSDAGEERFVALVRWCEGCIAGLTPDGSGRPSGDLINGRINGEIKSGVERLGPVRDRVRALAKPHPWFAGAIVEATVSGFPALHAAFLSAVGGKRPPKPRPDDPPDPWTNDVSELGRFSEEERRTICLFRLGGLADLGAVVRIVPEPSDTGAAANWIERMPALDDDESKGPDPRRFPPALAEEMLRAVEAWAESEAAGSGDAKPKTLPACVALTADHESILAVLGKTPTKCMTVIEVSSVGTIRNRETVGRLLGELAGFGMVDRPHGKRKGYALTDAGRGRLPGASPT